MSDLLERLAARADLARRVGVVYFAQPFPVRAALDGLAGECDEVAAELRAVKAENERLRAALREASEALDAAGCQVAASQAHRAVS